MNCKSLMFGGLLTLAGIGAANAAVVSGDLNLRSGPGTGYRVIDTMPAGSYVDVLGCAGAWCRVEFGGAVGYASASYLGGGGAYAAAPVYVEPPVYSAPYYAGPPIGFGFGIGSRWGWGGGHHRWHHHRHHH